LKTGVLSGAALLGLGELPFLRQLGRVSAEEAVLPPGVVRLRPEIEPLVRLLEETPRGRLLEEVAGRIRRGLSYREVLAALMLAAVKNIRPGPIVGFKLHGVMVVNAAHLASIASPPPDRWLPIFWALDYFKSAQARDEREGDWTMPALDDAALPSAEEAPRAFARAMARWDGEAADRAVAAWARGGDLAAIYEELWRYGARDYRDIGHKAIYAANSYRTLQAIGREHGEPVLRSLVRALNVYRGAFPPDADEPADRPWRENQERARRLRPGWAEGKVDDGASRALLAVLRQGSPADAAEGVVSLLRGGVAARSAWDAVFAYAGELVLRWPNIFSLHAQTTSNALHFAFRTAQSDDTRRLLLLQAASFLPYFRQDATSGRRGLWRRAGGRQPPLIDQLAAAPAAAGKGAPAPVEAIFARLADDRLRASEMLLQALDAGLDPQQVVSAARTLVFLKGDDSHDYKFSSAILEDHRHLSPTWRHRFLAANLSLLRSSGDRDNPLAARSRELLA